MKSNVELYFVYLDIHFAFRVPRSGFGGQGVGRVLVKLQTYGTC